MISEFAKDLIRYIPSKVIPGLFGIILIPLITRLIEPKDYGHYVLVISAVSIIGIIAVDWIAMSMTRFFPEYEKQIDLNTFWGTVTIMTIVSVFVTSLLTLLLLMGIRPSFDNDLYYYFYIGVLLFVLSAFYNVMLHSFMVLRKPNQYSFFSVWRQCICVLFGVGLVWLFKNGAEGLLWGTIIGVLVVLPILFRLSLRNLFIGFYSKKLCAESIQYGFPLVVTGVAGWILSLSDRYIIEFYRGGYEVGLYSISRSLADQSIMLIVSLIGLASAPLLTQIWEKKGVEETRLFVKELTRYCLIITLPAAIGLSLLSEPIIKVLTTKGFYEGYRIMPMVAVSIFFFGLQRNFQVGLLLYKKTNLIMYIVLFSGFANIVLNILLVPKYGFIAAGYSALITYCIMLVFMVLVSRKYFVWQFPFNTLLKVSTASIVMCLAIFIIKMKISSYVLILTVSVILGTVVYFLSLIIMNEIKKDELKKLLYFLRSKTHP